MRTMTIKVALLAGLAVVLGAGTSSAQALQYAGSLHMGLSDLNNEVTGRPPTNNALPICAGKGPLVNTDPAGTTEGTLLINAVGSGSAAVGGALTFNAVGGGNGGAQEKENATCNVANIPFANPRLRSRTQVGAAHFPGRKGDWTPSISTAPTPATPSATYMLSAGGGNTQAATAANFTTVWTITDEAGPVGPLGTPAPITAFTEMGAAHSAAVPFLAAAGGGAFRVQQAASQFGGGVPFSGGGGVQLGVNTTNMTPGGAPITDFGIVPYANGFLPTSPQLFGTDAKGVNIAPAVTTAVYGAAPSAFPFTLGLINGRQNLTYAFRTPGGSTINQQGNVITLNGGITASPMTGAFPPGIGIVTPVAFTGLFGEWTTGAVTHTDQVGDFRTVRKAAGFDQAVAPTAGNGFASRRLQVVSPWAAVIRTVGSFGVPLQVLGFGGTARMELNIIPAPEPGTIAMLGFGVMGLVGLGASRRRNG